MFGEITQVIQKGSIWEESEKNLNKLVVVLGIMLQWNRRVEEVMPLNNVVRGFVSITLKIQMLAKVNSAIRCYSCQRSS